MNMNDPKQKPPVHTAPGKPFTPPPAGKPTQPQQVPHQTPTQTPKFTDPKKK